MNLTDIEKTWLACAIDSEGSITLYKNDPRHYQCRISLVNTSKDYMDYAAKILNCNIKLRNGQRKNWKDCYVINISQRKIVKEILLELIPFLIIKKNKAIEGIKFIDGLKKNITIETRIKRSRQAINLWNSMSDKQKREKIQKLRLGNINMSLESRNRMRVWDRMSTEERLFRLQKMRDAQNNMSTEARKRMLEG